MSYEVTAARRRPQQFDDLVGQEFVAQTLKNSIKSGKIAHAYLFTGPRGCGKTSTARILAKALNCQNGPTEYPCGECSNCKEITKGSSLDVIEIDGASNTGVENVRQIKDEAQFPPSNSKYKIYIIDEVHMLSTPAFNALLKTIEEPPPYVIFIFATTELQKVPATIKSRCQQYNFRLVAIEKIKDCLAQAAAETNIQAEDEALFWIARESTGSMRDAYTLFDQIAAFSDGFITYEKIRDKLGLVGVERLNELFELCCQNRTADVFNLLDDILQSGVSADRLISACAEYLRSLMFIKCGVKKESLLGNAVSRYSSLVFEKWNLIQIERAVSLFLQLYKDIRYSLSPRYELEIAFARMCWIGDYVSNYDVKKAIDSAQKLLLSGETESSVAASAVLKVSDNAEIGAEQNKNPVEKKPNGLPVLKLPNEKLEGDYDDSAAFDNAEVSEKEDSRPFYDGGPLPPEQSTEAENNEFSYAETQNEKEQPQREKNEENDYVFDSSEENYDGEWNNADDISDDENYDEEQYIEESVSSYSTNKTALTGEVPAQIQDKFKTADGTELSVAQLRGNVMAALSIKDGFATSNLQKTGLWQVSEDSVETTVQNQYDLDLIKRKLPVIEAEISAVCGKQMKFSVDLQKEEKNQQNDLGSLPAQVEILLNAFKGTVIAGKV